MSAFVCPGAGQFMQKRWLAGLIYLAGFLASFFWLMVLAVSNIIDYYKMAFEYESHDPHPHSPMALLLPFGVALFFYLANLFDAYLAQQRIGQEEREAQFDSKP